MATLDNEFSHFLADLLLLLEYGVLVGLLPLVGKLWFLESYLVLLVQSPHREGAEGLELVAVPDLLSSLNQGVTHHFLKYFWRGRPVLHLLGQRPAVPSDSGGELVDVLSMSPPLLDLLHHGCLRYTS